MSANADLAAAKIYDLDMKQIAITVALLAGCGGGGESNNHTLTECDRGDLLDADQCELACAEQHLQVAQSCTAIYPPTPGSGTLSCDTTIAVDGVSGCCFGPVGAPDITTFWECSLEHTQASCDTSWGGEAQSCETPCVIKPTPTGSACTARVIVQPAPVSCDATFESNGKIGCCIVDLPNFGGEALFAECE